MICWLVLSGRALLSVPVGLLAPLGLWYAHRLRGRSETTMTPWVEFLPKLSSAEYMPWTGSRCILVVIPWLVYSGRLVWSLPPVVGGFDWLYCGDRIVGNDTVNEITSKVASTLPLPISCLCLSLVMIYWSLFLIYTLRCRLSRLVVASELYNCRM